MIPPLFHSIETDEPFERCIHCETLLAELEVPYVINKQFDRGECVMEFAMCQDCKVQMHSEMSEESKLALMRFFDDRVKMEQRSAALEGESYETWIKHCVTCGDSAGSKEAFALGAMGFGSEHIVDPYPLMICGKCQNHADTLLSVESRKHRDRFIAENFDGPPSDLAPLPSTPQPALF